MKNNIELKKRFVSEYHYPITVFEDPYWSYSLNLYNERLGCKTRWENLLRGIEKDYSGNADQFLKDFYDIRESMITGIRKTSDFEKYNQSEMSEFEVPEMYRSVRKDNIYNDGYLGKSFISIDLKKANFQSFNKYFPGVFGNLGDVTGDTDINDIYTKWLEKFKKGTYVDQYVHDSKYIREVVFGNLNPKRQIKVERKMICDVLDHLLGNISYKCISQIGSDEAIIEVDKLSEETEYQKIKEVLEYSFRKSLGIDIRYEEFTLETHKFLSPGGKTISIYRRVPEYDKSEKGDIGQYKGVSKVYYSQIFQWIYNIKPDIDEDKDLVFYSEKDLAKFLGRIKPI